MLIFFIAMRNAISHLNFPYFILHWKTPSILFFTNLKENVDKTLRLACARRLSDWQRVAAP